MTPRTSEASLTLFDSEVAVRTSTEDAESQLGVLLSRDLRIFRALLVVAILMGNAVAFFLFCCTMQLLQLSVESTFAMNQSIDKMHEPWMGAQ